MATKNEHEETTGLLSDLEDSEQQDLSTNLPHLDTKHEFLEEKITDANLDIDDEEVPATSEELTRQAVVSAEQAIQDLQDEQGAENEWNDNDKPEDSIGDIAGSLDDVSDADPDLNDNEPIVPENEEEGFASDEPQSDFEEDSQDLQHVSGEQYDDERDAESSGDDIELLGSRQVSVVEIDSEDEIENLEESETFGTESRVDDSTAVTDTTNGIQSFSLPTIVTTGKKEYLLVPHPSFDKSSSNLPSLFAGEELSSTILLGEFMSKLSETEAYWELNPELNDDFLKLTFNDIFTVSSSDHRADHLSLTEVVSNVQHFKNRHNDEDSPVVIRLSYDESPVAVYERLLQTLDGQSDSPLVEPESDQIAKKRRYSS
ncbi:hypothetical protein FT663_05056 [Candidozyma haemuli var. vulneris]|uniref:Uncharacterized protein n=1 Tax=Candidozyma haemuli TaxID=45357 RepID=A0A2V1AN96_9ASCO|nr:hypothetical protein CXQ85_003198 [[Candida] haemuloni]KAF3985468.1 hypothetical protein FT662_05138 [[Candida] haemuloni var. vulneris]KAF3986037.1 hypothetical protein FT663_05056 [[Candida] haemuloni var. vulneris]PVH19359.1 hypothetical protein CXQ85_003198 [[Candida] haemuloni]